MTDPFAQAMLRAHPEIPYTGQLNKTAPITLVSVRNPAVKQPKPIVRDFIHCQSDHNAIIRSKSTAILMAVCAVSGFSKSYLLSKTRNREHVRWRHIAMHLIKKHTVAGGPAVGLRMGGLDASTVWHGCKKIEADYESYRDAIEKVESFL